MHPASASRRVQGAAVRVGTRQLARQRRARARLSHHHYMGGSHSRHCSGSESVARAGGRQCGGGGVGGRHCGGVQRHEGDDGARRLPGAHNGRHGSSVYDGKPATFAKCVIPRGGARSGHGGRRVDVNGERAQRARRALLRRRPCPHGMCARHHNVLVAQCVSPQAAGEGQRRDHTCGWRRAQRLGDARTGGQVRVSPPLGAYLVRKALLVRARRLLLRAEKCAGQWLCARAGRRPRKGGGHPRPRPATARQQRAWCTCASHWSCDMVACCPSWRSLGSSGVIDHCRHPGRCAAAVVA